MCKVLILEEDDLVRDMLTSTLAMEGIDVHSVSTVQEALAQVAQDGDCRLLICSTELGFGPDGFQAAVMARHLRPELGLLFIGGRDVNGRQPEMPEGASLLHRPVDPQELAAAVQRLAG
jgi:DNA-binding response OmpR family regulator